MSLVHQNRFAESSGDDTVPALPQELFAAGVVENTPEVAPKGLPATFAMDAEDTESLASRNSEVSSVEDMGGDVPVNNRLVWDRDQDVPPEVRTAANLRTLAPELGQCHMVASCQGQSGDNGGPRCTFL